MTRNQTELFKTASSIAEKKIRQARAMQASETRDLVRQTVKAIVTKVRRSKESRTARRNSVMRS